MALETQDWLWTLMSNCLDYFEELLANVYPSADEEPGKFGWGSDLCLKSLLPDCSALGYSMKNEKEDLGLGGSLVNDVLVLGRMR
jgi:hypothetical protein